MGSNEVVKSDCSGPRISKLLENDTNIRIVLMITNTSELSLRAQRGNLSSFYKGGAPMFIGAEDFGNKPTY